MKYAEYTIIGKTAEGAPICQCPKCGQPQRVQTQNMSVPGRLQRPSLHQIDCTNKECGNYLHTEYVRDGEF